MKIGPGASYLIWSLISLIFLKYGIILIQEDNITFGSILVVLFVQFGIVLPVITVITVKKNEDNKL